jgi:hypothetical protein
MYHPEYGNVAQKIHFKLPFTTEWSWNPPKPKTVLVELLYEDAMRYAEDHEYTYYADQRLMAACKKAIG